jgi:hypothetical protein
MVTPPLVLIPPEPLKLVTPEPFTEIAFVPPYTFPLRSSALAALLVTLPELVNVLGADTVTAAEPLNILIPSEPIESEPPAPLAAIVVVTAAVLELSPKISPWTLTPVLTCGWNAYAVVESNKASSVEVGTADVDQFAGVSQVAVPGVHWIWAARADEPPNPTPAEAKIALLKPALVSRRPKLIFLRADELCNLRMADDLDTELVAFNMQFLPDWTLDPDDARNGCRKLAAVRNLSQSPMKIAADQVLRQTALGQLKS